MKKILLFVLILGLSCKAKDTMVADKALYTFDFVDKEQLYDVTSMAEAQQKLVFVDIYADWCLPCKIMDKESFKDKRLGEYYNERFVSYKVDGEKDSGPLIAELYDVKVYPTLLYLDVRGNLLIKKEGQANTNELYDLADKAVALAE